MSKKKNFHEIIWHAGLGFMLGWLWLFFLNGPLLYEATLKWDKEPEKIFLIFFLFHTLTYLTQALTAKYVYPLEKDHFLLLGGVILASSGTSFFLLDPSATLSPLILMAGGAAGVGSSLIIRIWVELYSQRGSKKTSLYFALAAGLGTITFLLLHALPPSTAIGLTALLPVLSAVFLRAARLAQEQKGEDELDVLEKHEEFGILPFPAKFLWLVIVFYLAGGLMQRIAFLEVPFSSSVLYWLANLSYGAVALFSGVTFYALPKLDLQLLRRPVLPLLGIAFVILPFAGAKLTLFTLGFLYNGAFALFDLYTLLLISSTAGKHPRPIAVVGWGYFLITFSILLGEMLLGRIFAFLPLKGREKDLVAIGSALLMFFFTFLLNDEKEKSRTREALPEIIPANESQSQEKPAGPQFFPNEALDIFLQKFDLTEKEKEILALLLAGRNNPYMREHLNITNNTLKTHLRNIYLKLDVKTRQETISLFYTATKEKTGGAIPPAKPRRQA